MKLPPSPEIKRVIAAVKSAGIEIGSVSITNDGVTVWSVDAAKAPELSPYDKWTASKKK